MASRHSQIFEQAYEVTVLHNCSATATLRESTYSINLGLIVIVVERYFEMNSLFIYTTCSITETAPTLTETNRFRLGAK
jgi:hypothetical protein